MLYWKLSHCQVPKYDTMKNLNFLKLIANPAQKIAWENVQTYMLQSKFKACFYFR